MEPLSDGCRHHGNTLKFAELERLSVERGSSVERQLLLPGTRLFDLWATSFYVSLLAVEMNVTLDKFQSM